MRLRENCCKPRRQLLRAIFMGLSSRFCSNSAEPAPGLYLLDTVVRGVTHLYALHRHLCLCPMPLAKPLPADWKPAVLHSLEGCATTLNTHARKEHRCA